MSKLFAVVAGIALILFTLTAWGQTPKQIEQCRTQNSSAFKQLVDLVQKEDSAGNFTPAMADTISRRLDEITANLNKPNQTIAECQQLSRHITAVRSEVQRMVAPVVQCRTQNRGARLEVLQIFQKARSSGNISPDEEQAFEKMEQHLNGITETLNKGGLTLPECQQLTREIANVRNNVSKMAATPASDPRVTQCRNQNQNAYNNVSIILARARSAAAIVPDQMQTLLDIDRQLARIRQNLDKRDLTLPECQQITRDIATENNKAQKIAANIAAANQKLAQCRAQNWKAQREALQLVINRRNMAMQKGGGKIAPDQTKSFVDLERRLSGIGQALGKGNLALTECEQLTREIVNIRSDVQKTAAPK